MTDAIDLSRARIVNGPDVRAWPATAAITQISFDGSTSRIAFTKQDGPGRWPDVVPEGWDGPLQYTWWLFLPFEEGWVGAPFVQLWHDRDGSGSPNDPDVPSLYHEHWFYAARWAPLYGHGPIRPGERIGMMVTSGNQRDSVGPNSVQERSNVVVLSATDRGAFTFADTLEPPAPDPLPIPAPLPVPWLPPAAMPIPPAGDPYMARFDRLETLLDRRLVGAYDASTSTIGLKPEGA